MPACPIDNPALLLPHSGKMVLLERICRYDAHSLYAEAAVNAGHILLADGADSLPAYLAAEIMAQGVAAWAGAHALDAGETVRLGFLLGTRKLNLHYAEIPVGTQLEVSVVQSWQDENGMGVFDCELRCRTPAAGHETAMPAGSLLVSGAMNVYSPRSEQVLQTLLNGS